MSLQIDPAEAARLLASADPNFVLLDCRDHEELQIARIDGAAHVPMCEIPVRANELDRSRRYVVFCHHGVRSRQVALYLKQNDFAHVQSMTGGINAWSEVVDPNVPQY
jgi:rhodanese-related sulfurtransferase